jgi:chromosomal replication initiation ATPase DnaA
MVVAQARQVAMYLLREDAGLPATQVSHVLGRSHSTVLHGYSRVARALAAGDPLVMAVLKDIRRSVRQSRCACILLLHAEEERHSRGHRS